MTARGRSGRALAFLAAGWTWACSGAGSAPDGAPGPSLGTPSAPVPASPAEPTPPGPPGPAADGPNPLTAVPDVSVGEERRALAALDRVARAGASDPDNPWAMAHGVLAFGADFRIRTGERALHRITSGWLEEGAVPDGKGGTVRVRGFPASRGEQRVEPHEDLVLKNAVEAGAHAEGPFGGVSGAPTRLDLVRDARLAFAFRPGFRGASAFPRPDDVAWSVQAFCQEAPRAGDRWTLADGREVALAEVAEAVLATLEGSTAFLAEARARGETRVQKRRQGIFGFTCGGAHLFQAAEACAAAGYPPGPGAEGRVAHQASLYLWRGGVENALYDEALAQAPRMAALVVNQRVKLLGHLLESLGKAEADRLWTPDEAETRALAGARRELLRAALRLEDDGVYGSLDALRGKAEQFYLDLVGDACHAVLGLRLQASRGRGPR